MAGRAGSAPGSKQPYASRRWEVAMTKWSMPRRPEGRAARAPDSVAAGAIYDRYADRVHDFSWSLLRDPDQAAQATERTFVAAMDQLEQVRDMDPLQPWLHAVAHRQVLALARPNGDGDGEAADPFAVGEAPKGVAGQDVEREVVWRAAAGLSGQDQALLTLHLRHGLEEAELGQALGVDAEQARVLVSRLPDQVGRSLEALLVGRRGRRDCAELAKLLGESEPRASLVRKRVTRHVDRCQTCARHRGGAEPLALLSAVPIRPAPPELREQVLGRIAGGADRGRPRWRRPGWRRVCLLAAALGLVVIGVFVWSQGQRPGGAPDGGRPSALGAGPRRPTTATGPPASAPTTLAPAASTTSVTTSNPSSTSAATSSAWCGPRRAWSSDDHRSHPGAGPASKISASPAQPSAAKPRLG
jgi:RNA polymerase sigma factor (sigma-70 family)